MTQDEQRKRLVEEEVKKALEEERKKILEGERRRLQDDEHKKYLEAQLATVLKEKDQLIKEKAQAETMLNMAVTMTAPPTAGQLHEGTRRYHLSR